jgi:hypothetical protein
VLPPAFGNDRTGFNIFAAVTTASHGKHLGLSAKGNFAIGLDAAKASCSAGAAGQLSLEGFGLGSGQASRFLCQTAAHERHA